MILTGTNVRGLLHVFHRPGPVLGAWHALCYFVFTTSH